MGAGYFDYSLHWKTRTSAASEPRERSAPAKRRARERVGGVRGAEALGWLWVPPGLAQGVGGGPVARDEPCLARERAEERMRDALRVAGDEASQQGDHALAIAIEVDGSGPADRLVGLGPCRRALRPRQRRVERDV